MIHSPYVATTLKTWEEKGTKKLQRLYARMGVPLAACQQKFSHMSAEYTRQLEAKMEEFGREVGLGRGSDKGSGGGQRGGHYAKLMEFSREVGLGMGSDLGLGRGSNRGSGG
eukprot:859541-Prorocentrum_minimum.AAC.3